jgi:four helix bundle protein
MRRVDEYEVFKRAHKLTLAVYALTARFPRSEIYGLASQMRRAAYSIPMNLKEGSSGTEAEFVRYVRTSLGSKEELDYQLRLARDLGYVKPEEWKSVTEEVGEIGSMLYGIIRKAGAK